MLHSTETLDLATQPRLKAKSLSGGCEIVLLTSSSFKTHVHLLHVVAVNQTSRLCNFSEFFFSICCVFYSACYTHTPDGKGTNLCLLNLTFFSADCETIKTNIKQETLLRLCFSLFFCLAWNLLLSAQRKQSSHTSANGGVFVYLVSKWERESKRVSSSL